MELDTLNAVINHQDDGSRDLEKERRDRRLCTLRQLYADALAILGDADNQLFLGHCGDGIDGPDHDEMKAGLSDAHRGLARALRVAVRGTALTEISGHGWCLLVDPAESAA